MPGTRRDPKALFWRLIEDYTRKIITQAIIDLGSVKEAADHFGIHYETLKDHTRRLKIPVLDLVRQARKARKEWEKQKEGRA